VIASITKWDNAWPDSWPDCAQFTEDKTPYFLKTGQGVSVLHGFECHFCRKVMYWEKNGTKLPFFQKMIWSLKLVVNIHRFFT
jgi:hypothetical protein